MNPMNLRSLRLWHWRKVVSFRARATGADANADAWERKHRGHRCAHFRNMARDANRNANFHLGAVQALNDHFAPGDTAEADMQRERA